MLQVTGHAGGVPKATLERGHSVSFPFSGNYGYIRNLRRSSAFTSPRISHGLLTQMQCWRRHISVSSSWDGWGSLERAPESTGPSTPALWRASWPAVSPPGLETAPLATAGLCKGSCELPATLLEVSFPPSRISTPGGVQGKPGGLLKTPATRPTDCSLCCPQGDVSAASDPALADWETAFSPRLSG